jgi:hypothetical protein
MWNCATKNWTGERQAQLEDSFIEAKRIESFVFGLFYLVDRHGTLRFEVSSPKLVESTEASGGAQVLRYDVNVAGPDGGRVTIDAWVDPTTLRVTQRRLRFADPSGDCNYTIDERYRPAPSAPTNAFEWRSTPTETKVR